MELRESFGLPDTDLVDDSRVKWHLDLRRLARILLVDELGLKNSLLRERWWHDGKY